VSVRPRPGSKASKSRRVSGYPGPSSEAAEKVAASATRELRDALVADAIAVPGRLEAALWGRGRTSSLPWPGGGVSAPQLRVLIEWFARKSEGTESVAVTVDASNMTPADASDLLRVLWDAYNSASASPRVQGNARGSLARAEPLGWRETPRMRAEALQPRRAGLLQVMVAVVASSGHPELLVIGGGAGGAEGGGRAGGTTSAMSTTSTTSSVPVMGPRPTAQVTRMWPVEEAAAVDFARGGERIYAAAATPRALAGVQGTECWAFWEVSDLVLVVKDHATPPPQALPTAALARLALSSARFNGVAVAAANDLLARTGRDRNALLAALRAVAHQTSMRTPALVGGEAVSGGAVRVLEAIRTLALEDFKPDVIGMLHAVAASRDVEMAQRVDAMRQLRAAIERVGSGFASHLVAATLAIDQDAHYSPPHLGTQDIIDGAAEFLDQALALESLSHDFRRALPAGFALASLLQLAGRISPHVRSRALLTLLTWFERQWLCPRGPEIADAIDKALGHAMLDNPVAVKVRAVAVCVRSTHD
jgi:hypothetical protein